ncbi:hypothetical protein BJX65DRAFT_285978 [Aspergillus insuetus]
MIKMDMHFPSEIWLHIGKEITQQRQHTLRSLTETCRAFHAIFTPLFLASLRFTKFDRICSPGFGKCAPLRNLRHVQTLKVHAGCGYAEVCEPEMEAVLYTRFHRNLIRCLEHMPNLVSFTFGLPGPWKTTEEEDDGVPYVPLFSNLLRTLQSSCPRLQTLAISVGELPALDISQWLLFASQSDMHRLVPFQNLASLAVAGGFLLPDSTDAVVSTLLASPGLTDLSLEQYSVPLVSVCKQYADAGGKPLALKRLQYRANLPREQDAWPQLHMLTDLGRLENLELECGSVSDFRADILNAPVGTVYTTLSDPGQFQSLRRLSVDFLDEGVFLAVLRVGNNLDLPPLFLSELFFRTFDSHGVCRGGFPFHPEKRKYWPTCFVLGQNVGKASSPAFRQGLAAEVGTWKALRLLHLQLDMKADQSRLLELTNSLNTNLRELYITDDHRARRQYPTDHDENYYGSQLDFASRLCANSRIAYLVLYDFYFRVVRGGNADVQLIRLEAVDLCSSEAEEAEIFMLYRERTKI